MQRFRPLDGSRSLLHGRGTYHVLGPARTCSGSSSAPAPADPRSPRDISHRLPLSDSSVSTTSGLTSAPTRVASLNALITSIRRATMMPPRSTVRSHHAAVMNAGWISIPSVIAYTLASHYPESAPIDPTRIRPPRPHIHGSHSLIAATAHSEHSTPSGANPCNNPPHWLDGTAVITSHRPPPHLDTC